MDAPSAGKTTTRAAASHRRYLDYFTKRLCGELMPFDAYNQNAFFTLLPLSRASPLLQHTLVAVSASHMANLLRPRLRLSAALPVVDESVRRAQQYALTAKHRALSLMCDAIQHIDAPSRPGG